MTHLENSSEKPSISSFDKLIWAFIIVAFCGFLDAVYLSAEHFSGAGLNCIIFEGCDKVASSPYSVMFGIPLALYGVAFYLSVLFFAILYKDQKKKKLLKLLPLITTVGFIFSLRFVYLQVFVIKAFCTYCILSAFTSTLLFILGIVLFRRLRY